MRGDHVPLAYDELVADRLADLLLQHAARSAGPGAMDAIIAATALVHDLEIWTQDSGFDVLAELAPTLRVLRGERLYTGRLDGSS